MRIKQGLAVLSGSLCLALLITGCGGPPKHHAAVVRRPPVVPGQPTAGPDLAGVKQPSVMLPFITGTVSRPRTDLTPGAVALTSRDAICPTPLAAVPIPYLVQTAVYTSYGYTNPAVQNTKRYVLDYLVPISLGGAPVATNVWPVSTRGIGVNQMTQLEHALYHLVCGGTITLPQAQHALEQDWFAAWLKYVVQAGHS